MKFRNLDLSDDPVNAEHSELGIPPVEESALHPGAHPILRMAMWLAIFMLVSAILYLGTRLFYQNGAVGAEQIIVDTLQSRIFWSAVAVGLLAQVIDGALGMAYGLTSTTFLLASGVSPAVASASVHIAEVFTTGVSGISHVKLGNVNKSLFLRLLLPGIAGAVLGAIALSSIDGKILKPYISIYLLLMGIYIISKVFRKLKSAKHAPKHVAKLALFGGFVDSVGGGGWGPVVTTTLVGSGHDPRATIGTVNFAEFFLTFASAIAFAVLVGEGPWPIVAGLVLGGLFAAPFAAYLCRRLHARTLLILVGALISLVSIFNLYKSFFA
ncbi:MAG: sulfite exporter TauE/SafE family protein [Pseudomonadota bacterium]